MRPPESDCICPKAMQSLGTQDGIRMGNAMLRTKTTKGCPVHDSCHGYTKEYRKERPSWGNPYCPIHRVKNCPA